MPMFSVFCHLSRHLVSCHIIFHQVSPSQLWSASISLSVYRNLQYLSRGIIFISPLHMSKPYQPLLSEEFCPRVHYVPLSRCLHFSHGLVSYFLRLSILNSNKTEFPIHLHLLFIFYQMCSVPVYSPDPTIFVASIYLVECCITFVHSMIQPHQILTVEQLQSSAGDLNANLCVYECGRSKVQTNIDSFLIKTLDFV